MEEQLQTIIEFTVAALTALTVYMTIVSGYLVAAYVAGDKLSLLQLCIITGLFVCFSSFVAIGTGGLFNGAINYAESVGQEYPEATRQMFWFQLIGIAVSIWFMVDRRMNKSNDT